MTDVKDNIFNKVIKIMAKEEDIKAIKLIDQEGVKFKFWKKKTDGNLTHAALQFKNMGLEEGSTARIGYVVESFDWKGKTIKSNKIINFQESDPLPESTQTQEFATGKLNSPKHEPEYVKEKDDSFWKQKGFEKCLWGFWLEYRAKDGFTLKKDDFDLVWEVFNQISKDAKSRFEITQEDISEAEESMPPDDYGQPPF